MEHDIIIIGGGPSGLSTALHIARDFPALAPRILILEKARYPRSKLCAGGLVLDAEVGALHVTVDGERVARNEAVAVGVPFHTTSGGVVERLSEAALKEHLLRLLPEHMVPCRFTRLDSFPLSRRHGEGGRHGVRQSVLLNGLKLELTECFLGDDDKVGGRLPIQATA